jgi:transcriptional regulator with XRE-family HTH domain
MDDEGNKPLGDTLREARVRMGLSLREVAKRVDKSPSYLSDIENNRRVPSEEVLRSVADLLHLKFDDLMARAGRFGEDALRYLMRTPAAGILMRKLSLKNASGAFVERLSKMTDQKLGGKAERKK